MCGIVGYIGSEKASDVLLDGLRRLEYRGYDSAGMVVVNGKGLGLRRSVGKLLSLQNVLNESPLTGAVGVGHTRWATHGRPSEENAHPHMDSSGRVVVVHNGIIENYSILKRELKEKGHQFVSQTDTEVIPHLISEAIYGKPGDQKKVSEKKYIESVRKVLHQIQGSYALGIVCADFPEMVIGARKDCPLILGVGENEHFLASDVPAILPRTRQAVFLEDGDIAILKKTGYKVFSIESGKEKDRQVVHIAWDAIQAEKSGYRHFMMKEINEQPRSIEDTLRGRLNSDDWQVHLGNLKVKPEQIKSFRRMLIVACGTSWHAGLVGKYLIEKWIQSPCEVDIASEFRYRESNIGPEDFVLVISQSGETADTIAALRYAKDKGAYTLSVCNVVGSTLARESHGKILTHCGPEIGVASTKAFTAQLTVLYMLALYGALIRETLTREQVQKIMKDLIHLPRWISETLKLERKIIELAKKFYKTTNFLFLGRGLNYPIALEGALKLKEISYIHAEGYPSGELKHGPIALIDPNMPVVSIVTKSSVYEKAISNVEEVKARGGAIIAVATEGDDRAQSLTKDIIFVPDVPDFISPCINVVPLQLLAYHIAVLRGCDVDQPRNLAKSVTVE